jgi:chemotaxis response regulator CheB
MEKRQHIFILGNSLILGAIGEKLRHGGQFDVTNLALARDVRKFEPIKPDAILFDLETPCMETILSLSENSSQLLLVGISQDTNIVRVWVSLELLELSMQDLLAVIKDQLNITLFERGRASR